MTALAYTRFFPASKNPRQGKKNSPLELFMQANVLDFRCHNSVAHPPCVEILYEVACRTRLKGPPQCTL